MSSERNSTCLRGGRLQVAASGHYDAGRAVLLGYIDLGAASVAVHTERRAQPLRLAWLVLRLQRGRREALPERLTRGTPGFKHCSP